MKITPLTLSGENVPHKHDHAIYVLSLILNLILRTNTKIVKNKISVCDTHAVKQVIKRNVVFI